MGSEEMLGSPDALLHRPVNQPLIQTRSVDSPVNIVLKDLVWS